ncbi:hypothetical protein MCERE19_03159 [Spirosomataceae bacterium]
MHWLTKFIEIILKLVSLTLSDLADISNVIIAGINLLLAGYIFFYQISKDKSDRRLQSERDNLSTTASLKLHEQNIRLQWFKDLIIQPRLNYLSLFFTFLHNLESEIVNNTLSEELRISINSKIKAESNMLRKNFCDILRSVNLGLHDQVQSNLDNLTDSLTEKIFNSELNLSDPTIYSTQITSLITYSHNDFIKIIYSYKGD